MKPIKKLTTKITLILASVLIITAIFGFSSDKREFEIIKQLKIFQAIVSELNTYYVDEPDIKKTIEAGINGMLASLDPYTNYIREEDMEDFKFMTTGEYGGVGSIISMSDTCYIMTREIYKGLPADKAGFIPGDYIIEINGKDAKNMKVSDVSNELRGTPGTPAKVKVWRRTTDEILNLTAIREKIQINPVTYYGMADSETGYIVLSNFTEDCSDKVMQAFIDLKTNHNAKKLILDLRGNPGGLLDEALNIVNMFVPKGSALLSTKGRLRAYDKTFRAHRDPIDTEIPLVVLISRSSASASEIVAGALQDLDRAIIIGQRSFGKGLVQGTREISYNNGLKLTTAKYYTPSGRCIQALDYSHRDKDGAVGFVPDSLISEFKTLNGRSVFDGGGVSPDIMIKLDEMSTITYSLIINDIIFRYAVDYRGKHKSIAAPKDFTLTDEDYNKFCEFVKNQKDFTYKSRTDEVFKKLKEVAVKEKNYEQNKEFFAAMENKLKPNLERDLKNNRKEIQEAIESEILTSYYYQQGPYPKSIMNDNSIKEAISTLNDSNRYKGLLDGSIASHAGDKRTANSK